MYDELIKWLEAEYVLEPEDLIGTEKERFVIYAAHQIIGDIKRIAEEGFNDDRTKAE